MSLSQLLKNNKFRYGLYVLVAQGLFMLCNLFINHWISKSWYVEGFSIYNLIKRISAFIVYPLLVGAGISVPRYISFLKAHNKNQHYEYLLSAVLVFCATFSGFSLIVLLFPQLLLKAFAATSYSTVDILSSVLLFVLSQGLFVLLTSYYRGRFQFGLMSLTNIAVMSFLPTLSLFFVSDIFSYFHVYSLTTLLIMAVVVLYHFFKQPVSFTGVKLKSVRLLKYGYPRIVGELSLFSLEFMPLFLVSLYIGLEASGYMAMTFLLLKLAATLYELSGSLLFPYFGQLFKSGLRQVFVYRVNQLLIFGILSSVIVLIGFYFFIPVVTELFFPALAKAIFPSQMVFIVFPSYSVYLLLRNILDIMMDKAYNSINLGIVAVMQIALLAAGIYFKNDDVYYKLAIALPYLMLGVLTYLAWLKTKSMI